MPATVYTRTLWRAAARVGGTQTLAALMNVSNETLASWLDGRTIPPTAAFLIAVDLLSRTERSVLPESNAPTALPGRSLPEES